jgi:hypothetical protein
MIQVNELVKMLALIVHIDLHWRMHSSARQGEWLLLLVRNNAFDSSSQLPLSLSVL